MEAMNSGLPIITSNVVGLKEIVDTPPNPYGILISPDSPSGITDAVRNLLYPEKRALLGENAFKRSMAFWKERMIKSYNAEYNIKLRHNVK